MSQSRKALVRAYKETARPMGVYRVRNVQNGRSLVRASVDLPAALNRERAQLRLDGHRSRDLQRDWNALGPDAFTFEVLDTLEAPAGQPDYDPRHDLQTLERLWLERLEPFGERGYTPRPVGWPRGA